MDNSLKEILRQYVQERGIELFQDSTKLKGILSDLVKDDEKGCKKIKTALSAGAGVSFYNIVQREGVLTDIGRKRFITTLSDSGFTSEFCNFVIDVFAYSISTPKETPPDKAAQPDDSRWKHLNAVLNQQNQQPKPQSARELFQLGLKYANGEGVPRNYQRAAELYHQAAQQGHAGAQNNLSVCYQSGRLQCLW